MSAEEDMTRKSSAAVAPSPPLALLPRAARSALSSSLSSRSACVRAAPLLPSSAARGLPERIVRERLAADDDGPACPVSQRRRRQCGRAADPASISSSPTSASRARFAIHAFDFGSPALCSS